MEGLGAYRWCTALCSFCSDQVQHEMKRWHINTEQATTRFLQVTKSSLAQALERDRERVKVLDVNVFIDSLDQVQMGIWKSCAALADALISVTHNGEPSRPTCH